MADGNTTSYSLDKPTYAYTARTTEFDDALIRRGIVTLEQAMMGKGASAAEAKRLAAEARERAGRGQAGAATATATVTSMTATSGNKAEDGGSSDDEFLEEYRRTRLREMEEVAGGRRRSRRREGGHGDLVPISRPDWTREVNEASRGGRWVVVLLTLGGGGGGGGAPSLRAADACRAAEEAAKALAADFPEVKFVSIPARAANEHWPEGNLPTLFCYRNGKLREQMVGIGEFGGPGITAGRIEWRLAELGVVETELGSDPERGTYHAGDDDDRARGRDHHPGGYGAGRGGGVMGSLATHRGHDEAEDDLSDID